MDKPSQNPSSGSTAPSINGTLDARRHAAFSGPLGEPVPVPVPVAPTNPTGTSGTPQSTSTSTSASASAPFPPSQGNAQIARSGGIGLATTIGSSQAAMLQEKLRKESQQAPPVARPQAPYPTAPRHAYNNSTGQLLQFGKSTAPHTSRLTEHVPNPLLGGGPRSAGVSATVQAQQPQQPNVLQTQRPIQIQIQPQPQPQQAPRQAPRQVPQHPRQAPLQSRPAVSPAYAGGVVAAQQQQQRQPAAPQNKMKVVLSQEAKTALAKAIWSAIRSPDGQIVPELMQAALATGLPKLAILNAARVAREREASKRKSTQQQQQQQQRQQPHQASAGRVPMAHRPHQQQHQQRHPQQHSSHVMPQTPQMMRPQLQPVARVPVAVPQPNFATAPKPAIGATAKSGTPSTPASRPSSTPKVKPLHSLQQLQTAKLLKVRADERNKWMRVQQGVFVLQKGKFLAPPHTVTGVTRTLSIRPIISAPVKGSFTRRRPRPEVLMEAERLQQMLRNHKNRQTKVPLLEPEKYKRIKIEAKKHAKALDRVVRKSRETAAASLIKQHKEFSKAIASHQADFSKFHKQRRADALKVAKLIRDNFDKESKKKEKEGVAAERARLAALKANDMDAYSKLLEETKNDRLKFLMDKTEKHFSQISTSLLQERNRDGSVVSSGGTASYYASAHLKTEEVRQPSILTGGDLKEYQMGGLQWLISLYNNKLNGILADEMGLGKTIQAISLIAYLMEFKGNLGPYLVIVPLSTLSNWVNEFQKWCPSAHVICYKGTPGQRKELYKEQVKNGHFNVLLTTYEYIIKDKASLRKTAWQYAIVDEGHRMKNAASKFAKTLSTQYETKYRLLLTGTPLMNDLSELWSLLNFLLPVIFNSVDTFDTWFNRPFSQFGNSAEQDESNFLSNEERMFIIHRLHELLRPFMLRRVKSEVLDQLPEKVEKILRCELSSWQKELYKQISKKAVTENSMLGSGFVQPQPASRGLNNIVMQLRKVCNHPYLFAPQGYQINENIIRSSGKFELLDRMLPKLRTAGHRVLMFTQMTAVMTILEDYFAYRGYLSLRLDGSTPAEEREKRMYKFNSPDSPYFIFLLSTRAGGLGLNLTSANTVVIFDSDWNPMMDLQAQDRAHRIGQRSDVSVFRLITHSPVEEKILSRATEKLNMSELVVEAGKFDKTSVENDNSLERKKMMEVLLTDFDTNTGKTGEDKVTSEVTGSEADDEDNDDDDESESSKEEDLNDLISNNENDYQLYKSIDEESDFGPVPIDASLFTNYEDIPDWVKYPSGKKAAQAVQDGDIPGSGPRKRKEVMYDDGLTEKQFLRMMDKQYDVDTAARGEPKQGGKRSGPIVATAPLVVPEIIPGSELTDWTFRKLISVTKAVITLKDPSTKRRLCEIFLEKPSPGQFPDYYELIEKPMAINDVLRKCRGKLYTTMQEYRDDWKLMFANAKTFNGEGSWVVQDGISLQKELDRLLKKNGFGEEAPKKPQPPKKKKLRIKLSLKTLKAIPAPENRSDPAPAPEPESVDLSGRGRKKKRKIK